MPTYEWTEAFGRDLKRLTAAQRAAFEAAIAMFIEDLRGDGAFRKGLRVKKLRGHSDIFELTWAADGRATWRYGQEQRAGEPHVVWRRIGTHQIFDRP